MDEPQQLTNLESNEGLEASDFQCEDIENQNRVSDFQFSIPLFPNVF